MSPYSISNSAYPGACATTLSIPVIEDAHAAMAVQLPFRAQLQIGTPFSLTLEQAIQAADRHVYVHGRPPNPISFVEDWINPNVLRLIENSDWLALADFKDRLSEGFEIGQWVRSDGLFRKEVAINPNSPEATDIESQLRTAME